MIDVEVLTPQPLNVGIPPVGTVIKGKDGENGKSPYIGEHGTWMVFDDATKEWVDTGVIAGDTGEVRPGEPGKDGEDGFSPTAKVEKADGVATFTVTDKTGTTSVQILDGRDGVDGRDGLPGKDGDTPQKGVDYWTEADKTEIADALKNDFVPASISDKRVSMVASGTFVEKTRDVQDIHFDTNSYTVRDSTASGKIDLSGTATHGVVENMHFSEKDAGILIDKSEGWSGSNRFHNLFFRGCEYPITLYSADTTDTVFDGITIENARQGVRINTQATFRNIYVGDNMLATDNDNADCAFLVKGHANISIADSTVTCGVRPNQNNSIITFDTTEAEPAMVELINCNLHIANQNTEGGQYGSIANLSNKNDRLFIDNCRFDVYPARINSNHSVAPFMLKPFRTVWSKNPFYSYVVGGDLTDIHRFAPCAGSKAEAYAHPDNLVNPFGGSLVNIRPANVTAFYSIPANLVGKTMYIHAYIGSNGSSDASFRVQGAESDCKETGSIWLEHGEHPEITPYLNIGTFTPTKRKGKIVIGCGINDVGLLAGIFLVEQHNREMICAYEEWDRASYSDSIPTYTGEYGNFVYSIDPETTDCDGWRYTTEWTAFTIQNAEPAPSVPSAPSETIVGSAMRLISDTVLSAESNGYAITKDKDGKALSLTHAKIHVFSTDGVWTDAGYVGVNGAWSNTIFCGGNTMKTLLVEYDTMLKMRKSVGGTNSQQVSNVYNGIFNVDTITSIHITPNGGKVKAGVRVIVAGY